MLLTISILTALVFSVLYPLCFLISAKDPLKNNFHRFHLGLPCVVGGIVTSTLSLLPPQISPEGRTLVMIWFIQIFFLTRYFWHRGPPNPYVVTLVCLVGLAAFVDIHYELVGPNVRAIFLSILSGFILVSAIYAMNLGHWYLNVHGLPIAHLMRAVYVFWAFVFFRAAWDIGLLTAGKVLYHGDTIPLYQFIGNFEGFFLLMAITFGTIFPLITLYFVRGTLLVKSTQSATGILYVILVAVLIGELTFKYYLIKFGIIL